MASSIEEIERVGKIIRVSAPPAALTVASYPSGSARPSNATGAIKTGIDTCSPSTVVVISLAFTPTSMRGSSVIRSIGDPVLVARPIPLNQA